MKYTYIIRVIHILALHVYNPKMQTAVKYMCVEYVSGHMYKGCRW